MSDYLKSVVNRRWTGVWVSIVIFIAVGMIGYGELHWILFGKGEYPESEMYKIIALFGLLHLMSYVAALAVMLLYKNNIDTNIGAMGRLQKRMLIGAIQEEMDMVENITDIKDARKNTR